MEQITAPIRLFTYQNTTDNSIQLMSLSIQYNNTDFYLHGSIGDSIYIFKESIALYVLTINRDTAKISLNTYMAPEADAITTVTLHTLQEIEEIVGQNWKYKEPLTIVRRLVASLF